MSPEPPSSMLILVGTKAQYIKTAPILREMRDRGVAYRLVYTGQHSETFSELEAAFGLPTADENLVPATEADSAPGLLRWMFRFLLAASVCIRSGEWRRVRWGVVHGDTASTLLTAVALRVAGVPVAHVEAGLRSPRLLSPFPEELIRRWVSRLASLHLAPDATAAAHLSERNGRVVDTHGNTMLDALRMAVDRLGAGGAEGGAGDYAIATLHRSENLASKDTLDLLLEEIVRTAETLPVKFVLHPVTRRKLGRNGWLDRLESTAGVELVPRTDYVSFVATMVGARFLMTDGGSNQEEAAMLGLPTLLLRSATERQDGLESGTVVMSNLSRDRIRAFVARHASGSRWIVRALPHESPSRRIVDVLLAST